MIFPNDYADKDFILSDEYYEVLSKKWSVMAKKWRLIGSWRWKCVYNNRHLIADLVFDENKKGIDFGGYMGPIGGYTTVVDKMVDVWLKDFEDDSIDYIFTSHTLEHVDDIDQTLAEMYRILKPNGKLVAIVPSYKKRIWRKENDPCHNYTFKLEGTPFENADCIDVLTKNAGFNIIRAEYCPKFMIFIYGEKK